MVDGPLLPPLAQVCPEDLLGGEGEFEQVCDIWSADARAARCAAELAVWVARLARRRRILEETEFGPRGGPGRDTREHRPPCLGDVSETFVPELALIRRCTEAEAATLAVESILLTTRLRATWGELYEGRIDVRRMRVLVDLLGTVPEATAAEVERRVLPAAENLTTAQLRARVRRVLAQVDAEALEARRAEAARQADVRHQPMDDGMSQLVVDLPTPTALACLDAVRQYAEQQRSGGDERPIGVIRADVVADLLLRPWDTNRPAVTAQLTVHAPLSSLDAAGPAPAAAEVDGEVVSAAQCRELLRRLDVLGVGRAPVGGSVQVAVTDATGRVVAVATRRELRRAAGGGNRRRRREGRPPVRTADGTSTSREVDTSTRRHVDGPGLRGPGATAGYRPTAGQRRLVRTRDRHCRWPGCRRRPGRCDIDHGRAWTDGGPTTCWNLCCLCRTHHRIKTFARGWHFELLADGRLLVRTPSGVLRTTRPPGWAADPEPDPPWLEETAPPDPFAR